MSITGANDLSFRKYELAGYFTEAPDQTIVFDGKSYSARKGEPLALTLMAHGVTTLGRSAKYHRPRGAFCGRGSCGRCLAQVSELPNMRLCSCHVEGDEKVESQNVVGSAKFDLLSTIDWIFPNGIDHHHLMVSSSTLNRVATVMARQLAGLGKAPKEEGCQPKPTPPPAREVDLAIVGAGPAGLKLAQEAQQAGLSVALLEAHPAEFFSGSEYLSLREAGVLLDQTQVIGLFDDRELLALRDDTLLRYHFKTLVLATGANPQTPPITGNDLPGIISLDLALSAARYGISPGREIVFAFDKSTDPATFEQATQLAEIFGNAGFEVKAALGISKTNGAFKRAIPTFLEAADGTNSLENVTVDGETLSCDALIWCGRSLPAYELARQCGVDVRFESSIDGFLPQVGPLGETARSDLYLVGEVTGRSRADAAQHAQALAEHLIPQIVKINQEAQPNGSTR